MSNIPLISVIVPIYNGEKYIRKCMDSILAQTYNNLEIILVDDGSTDTSAQKCDAYAAQDKRVRVIHQQNGGLSAARNAGIKIAQGEYLSFIDVDDWVDATFIEMLWKVLLKYGASVSVVGRYAVFAKGMRQECISVKPGKEQLFVAQGAGFNTQQTLEMIFEKINGYVTNKLFHAVLFKDICFPEGITYEDSWTLFHLFPRINKIAVHNTPLYYYNRQNENSISKGKFRMSMLDYFKVTDVFLAKAKTFKSHHMLHFLQRERLAHICGFFKRMMLSNFNDWNVIEPMQQELRHNLWLFLRYPRPLKVCAFGASSAINFKLTKKILGKVYKHAN